MNLHHYSVSILEGRENNDGYVCLEHGTCYTLKLSNDDSLCCDAEVFLDGQRVGLWRIGAYKSLWLERPSYDEGKFTFYRTGTKEATKAEVVAGDMTGLVRVVFKPERQERRDDGRVEIHCARPWHPGGTGLSGRSEQRFVSVEPICYEDPSKFITINLRLVAAANEPRPLFARSTPVPAAVG